MKPFSLGQTPPGPLPTYSQVVRNGTAAAPQQRLTVAVNIGGAVARLHGRASLRPPLALPRPSRAVALSYQGAQVMFRYLEAPLRKQYEALSSRLNGPMSLTAADEAYRKNLTKLTQAFVQMLLATNGYTSNLEYLHRDLAQFLAAHLQHSRALLASEAALGTKSFSYLKFAPLPGYQQQRAILRVPIEGREHTVLPQSYELLNKLVLHCPLPALRGQVSGFYQSLAQLAVARNEKCGSSGVKKMFAEVAHLWRSYAAEIEAHA